MLSIFVLRTIGRNSVDEFLVDRRHIVVSRVNTKDFFVQCRVFADIHEVDRLRKHGHIVIGISDEDSDVGVVRHTAVGCFDFQEKFVLIIRWIVVDGLEEDDCAFFSERCFFENEISRTRTTNDSIVR